MFDFLEREGAQVIVEPIATWVAYLMYQAKAHAIAKWPVNRPHRNTEWYELKKNFANYIGLHKKLWGLALASGPGNISITGPSRTWVASRTILCRKPSWLRWRILSITSSRAAVKGTLKLGKNVYYTVHKLCHMVLALKPFGCMPSSQSTACNPQWSISSKT